MNNQQIIRCLQECATKLNMDLNISKLKEVDIIPRQYEAHEVSEFQRDLVEAANAAGNLKIEKYQKTAT